VGGVGRFIDAVGIFARPFKHQSLKISMTTFKTLVLAGTFLSNDKSGQESNQDRDDGSADAGNGQSLSRVVCSSRSQQGS